MKRRIYTIYMLILLYFSCIISLTGQSYFTTDLQNYRFIPQNLGHTSPETAALGKYGNLDISYYNGLLNLPISIYEYKDRDFNIPIKIKYVSTTFKPNQRSSWVGQNWSLVAGGVITRVAKGTPDDVKQNISSSSYLHLQAGLLVAVRDPSIKKYTKDELINIKETRSNSYDLEPDIFQFTFGEYSGRFIIDHTGKPVLIDSPGCNIDISGLSVQDYSLSAAPSNSTIMITTPDGYIYEFGGNTDYLEYVVPSHSLAENSSYIPIKTNPRHITAWHLKTIKAPNGRVVNYTYDICCQLYYYSSNVSESMNGNVYTTADYEYKYLGGEVKRHSTNRSTPILFSKSTSIINFKDKIYTPTLKNIQIDDVSIDFEKGLSSSYFYEEYNDADRPITLEQIKVQSNQKLVHTASFQYLNVGKYFQLDKLNIQDQHYSFEYYTLPLEIDIPKTMNTDHWGAWAGEQATSGKSTNASVYNVGLLKKVIYPTGGHTEMEYEYNRFNYISEKKVEEKACAGARVRTIKDYDIISSKYSNIRTFSYIDPLTKMGSGSINDLPKYSTEEQFDLRGLSETFEGTSWFQVDGEPLSINIKCNTDKTIYTSSYSTMNIATESALGEYHIGYSDVIESFEDGSYIHYKYSSHRDVPDDGTQARWYATKTSFDPTRLNGNGEFESIFDKLYRYNYRRIYQISPHCSRSLMGSQFADKYGLLKRNDMSRFRGNLVEKKTYSKNKKLVYTEKFSCNLGNSKNNFEMSVFSNLMGASVTRIFTTPYLLLQKQTTDEHGVIVNERFSYNDKNFISNIEVNNSNSISHAFSFKYPSDEISSTDINIKELNTKNIIKSPILVTKTVGTGTNNIVDAIKTDFTKHYNMVLQHNIYNLETISPLSLSNINSYFVKKETYQQYDSYGNPIEIIINQLSTFYLWCNKGQYLVAKIENATYSQVEAAVKVVFGVVNIDGLSRITTLDETKIPDLRTNINLANAFVTTYTYKPLVGMTSITDPSGLTTYYYYDKYGRLNETYIKDNNKKKIIKEHKYNYRKK